MHEWIGATREGDLICCTIFLLFAGVDLFCLCVSNGCPGDCSRFVSVQRKNLTQGDCRIIEGSTLSGTLENAAVTHET